MGAEGCCESKTNLNGIKKTEPNKNINFYEKNKINNGNLQNEQTQKNFNEPKIYNKITQKNINNVSENDDEFSKKDRHVSLGSSIENSMSKDQISIPGNSKNDEYNSNLYPESNTNNNKLYNGKENYYNNEIKYRNGRNNETPVSSILTNENSSNNFIPFKCEKSFKAHEEKIEA